MDSVFSATVDIRELGYLILAGIINYVKTRDERSIVHLGGLSRRIENYFNACNITIHEEIDVDDASIALRIKLGTSSIAKLVITTDVILFPLVNTAVDIILSTGSETTSLCSEELHYLEKCTIPTEIDIHKSIADKIEEFNAFDLSFLFKFPFVVPKYFQLTIHRLRRAIFKSSNLTTPEIYIHDVILINAMLQMLCNMLKSSKITNKKKRRLLKILNPFYEQCINVYARDANDINKYLNI